MKTEAGLAVSYLRIEGAGQIYVGVPAGTTARVHLPGQNARARFVTALLKAKCEPGETLELFGEPVADLAPRARARLRRRIAALSPIVGLVSNLNVWENVSLPAAYHGAPPLDRVAALAEELLAALGVEPASFLARLPEDLNAFEHKLASLLRLLAAQPELALLDGLDEGLGRAERSRIARFEAELRERLPLATLLYVDSKEED